MDSFKIKLAKIVLFLWFYHYKLGINEHLFYTFADTFIVSVLEK